MVILVTGTHRKWRICILCFKLLLRSIKTLGIGTQKKWLLCHGCFNTLLRSTKTLGVGTQRKWLIWELCFITLLRSTKTFLRGLEQRRRRLKVLCFPAPLRFKTSSRVPMPSLARRARVSHSLHLHHHQHPPWLVHFPTNLENLVVMREI